MKIQHMTQSGMNGVTLRIRNLKHAKAKKPSVMVQKVWYKTAPSFWFLHHRNPNAFKAANRANVL
jgi:hypothetical protein